MSEPNFQLAKYRHRFVAWIIDIVIIGIILSPIPYDIFLNSIIPDEKIQNTDWQYYAYNPLEAEYAINYTVFGIIQNIVFLLYWSVLEARYGQSVGKKILGIKTTDMMGNKITFRDSFVQSFGKSFLLPVDVIGCLIFTKKYNQRLFNKLSNTIIIRHEKQ